MSGNQLIRADVIFGYGLSGKPRAHPRHNHGIPPIRHQFHRCTPVLPCNPERCQQKQAGDDKVGPGVERPLAVPGELQRAGKGLEVGDGPLVAVGAAGADEVAQQVQMEADEDEKCGEPWMSRQAAALYRRAEGEVGQRPRDDIGGKGTHQGKCQRMQRMMVLGKPQQWMRCVTGEKFRDDAEAVDIRRYGCGHDERFFTPRERGRAACG